ncbi:aspartyl-tRNA(Asn)/glutamyl-tRNA(Gln) amidotransferase subunit A [Granulicella rosea]|uniref:Aspartyl-tRNA(Asn)/glutamyl-tRNA(Gln) amidotransferase subunit A n=1 Tax=Granulicella rosea TaxID=474952 RepID=A0A239M6L3_9BACT|nr:amidase [Granulicella rosea]SNT38356.1 aspartyl-tRNA(Asn)/glutamyl-tRNA(Gln) amidotransferase subunit A [Granulicella rosea]
MSAIENLREHYLHDETTPLAELDAALANSNGNAGRNVYLAQHAEWSRGQALALDKAQRATQPLWGVPVSLKDCFDLEGFATSCGSGYYQQTKGLAERNSALAKRLKALGAVITGKTHMQQLAYGITGENLDFGDCVQPRNPRWLTGGSSSGAAASVQEGSALAAIGTDTGGSIRVPAALCGIAGYRSSISLQGRLWEGGGHLAPTFDTIGWLYPDLADGPLLGGALFDLPKAEAPELAALRIGIPTDAFLHDCEPDVLATLAYGRELFTGRQARVEGFDAAAWDTAFSIFAPIQAHEAAAIHRGHYEHFEPGIAERLAWGASLPADELSRQMLRLWQFRARMSALFQHFDYLLLPACPMSALLAGEDQSQTRVRILRYTSPISLAGLPVVTLPGRAGGLQLVGRLGADAELLALSASLADATL